MRKVGVTVCQGYDKAESKIDDILKLHGGVDSLIKKNDHVLLYQWYFYFEKTCCCHKFFGRS